MTEIGGPPVSAAEVVDPEQQPSPGLSIVERLRRQRKYAAEHQTHDLDIPGYGGLLFCRYKLLDGKQLNTVSSRIRKTIRDQSEAELAACCDTLIAACSEFFLRDPLRPVGQQEYPLSEEMGSSTPVRYDAKLAEFCDFQLDAQGTARQVVIKLFLGNEVAMFAHNQALSLWMISTGDALDQEAVGE